MVVAISSWQWIWGHRTQILHLLGQHAELTVIAVAVGLAISLPLALIAYRHGAAYAPITWLAGLLYTIPSLALFALLTPFTRLSITTAEIGLVSYTLLILIRNIVVGLRAVPEDVKEAARGMGHSRRQLLWRVELPLAVPAIAAGIRVATVSTIGLITVAALIGKGGLGQLILEGLRILYPTEILVGAVMSVIFALFADALLLAAERSLTPWTRGPKVVAWDAPPTPEPVA
jgi:osmoprotectant transport system permease protein